MVWIVTIILRVVGVSLFIFIPVRIIAVVLVFIVLLYSYLYIISLYRFNIGFERYSLSNYLIYYLRAPYLYY